MRFDLLRRLVIVSAVTFYASLTMAQNSDREFEDYIEYETHIEILTSDGKLALTPYSDKIIEVQFLTPLQPANDPSWSVVKTPEKVVFVLEDEEELLTLSTAALKVEIQKDPFHIRYHYKDQALVSENLGYFEEGNYSGFKFNMSEGEAIFGGGARALSMNRRGYSLPLYNTPAYGYGAESKDVYYSIPLVISSKQYMILFDNAPKGVLDTGETDPDVLSMHSIGGRKVYYIIAGDSFLDLNTQYVDLTGRQPLPPRWTLGNIASRFGYRTQKEAEDTIDLYKEKTVPVDAVVIDLFWFGKDIQGHMGNLDWDYDAWPKPRKMMKKFDKQGVNTILITEPFVLNTSTRWQEALDADILAKNYRGEPYIFDFYFGTSGLIDIFKPEAKAWFWDIYKHHTDRGVDAWWGDLGEPESHAPDMVHVAGTAEYVHNVFGHEWAKTLYQGYQRDYPEKRPATLMRAGFAGSQRYGMIPWSGDVARNWQGLKPQPALTIQMGMQGLGYAHSDLGGFAPRYVDDVLFSDPMLFTRWLQYGVFQPIFRPHSHESSPPEPVYWDERTLALTREAINLRYRMYAYNYTLAYENATKGYPLMRPLFYVEPHNTDLYNYSASYLWGDNILVAPVLESKQSLQAVYFPKNGNWVDFYTGARHLGGSTADVPVIDEYIPTFVKSGSFLPLLPAGLQTSRDYTTAALEVLYYADKAYPQSSYTLYDDDGVTHKSIENGKHELLTFSANHTELGYQFKLSSNGGKFKGKPRSRSITLQIKHLGALPKEVNIDGKTIAVVASANKVKKRQKVYAIATDDNTVAVTVVMKSKPVSITF